MAVRAKGVRIRSNVPNKRCQSSGMCLLAQTKVGHPGTLKVGQLDWSCCMVRNKGCGYQQRLVPLPDPNSRISLTQPSPLFWIHLLLLRVVCRCMLEALATCRRAVLKTVAIPHLHGEVHLNPSYTPTAQLRRVNRLCLCCEISLAPPASWENQTVMSGLVCERMGLGSEANALEPKLWSQKFWIQILNTLHSNCTEVGDPVASWDSVLLFP